MIALVKLGKMFIPIFPYRINSTDERFHCKTIIATAIPQITKQFNSLDQVGWYASALLLTVAATQSVWGKAYKYFSIKIVYLISIFVFELGSLICGKTSTLRLLS